MVYKRTFGCFVLTVTIICTFNEKKLWLFWNCNYGLWSEIEKRLHSAINRVDVV